MIFGLNLGFTDLVADPPPKSRRARLKTRGIGAAKEIPTLNSFRGSPLSINQELKQNLRKLRERSRQLSNDNPHIQRYLQLLQSNVVGNAGIFPQAQVLNNKGTLDNKINERIEQAFQEWSEPENCSASGNLSFWDIENLVISSLARDGEVLCQFISNTENPFGFSLHILESDYLDETHNNINDNLSMGIKHSEYGRPISYFLHKRHPGDVGSSNERIRVPASSIIHLFKSERPGQLRGLPWTIRAMIPLRMLQAYSEAELTASRIAAVKGGFFTTEINENYLGYTGDEQDPDGDSEIINLNEPGQMEELPAGMKFQPFDPTHPVQAFDSFTKTILREIAAGLNISYASLTTDLSDVNFSSIRQGALEEREHYRSLRKFISQSFCRRVYRAWLPMAISSGKLNVPMSDLNKYKVSWHQKQFPWIDPLKEIQAHQEAVSLGVQSRTNIANQQGLDLDEIFQQLKNEEQLAKKYGINLSEFADKRDKI